jgi:hypothetical protein
MTMMLLKFKMGSQEGEKMKKESTKELKNKTI